VHASCAWHCDSVLEASCSIFAQLKQLHVR